MIRPRPPRPLAGSAAIATLASPCPPSPPPQGARTCSNATPDHEQDEPRPDAAPEDGDASGGAYELADDPEPTADRSAAPKRQGKDAEGAEPPPSDAEGGGEGGGDEGGGDEGETYDLDHDPEPARVEPVRSEPGRSGGTDAAAAGRSKGGAKSGAASRGGAGGGGGGDGDGDGEDDLAPMRDKSGKPLPKQWSKDEPAHVDPEVKRLRREEERKRAAEQAAIEAAKSRRIKLILAGLLVLVAVAVAIWNFVVR